MSITIVSLNLWRFYDWEKRFPEIIRVLKEINPDVICTQETQKNIAISPLNQIDILNNELKYPHSDFAVADIKHQQKGEPLKYPVDHGLGILSRFPITTKVLPLTKAVDDKEQRILLNCQVVGDDQVYNITNLHFSNSDRWAEDHFKETLEILRDNNLASILVGDFNIFNISKYKEIYGQEYIASSELFDYISYPKDNASLDYILLPNSYQFESFECRLEYLSDHRMIVAKIKAK